MAFVAGPTTFGGRQAFADLQAAFNKKFGLNARLNLTAGPSMPAMAARIITEAKAGRKSSTDVHLGPPATHAELHNEKLLERVDYSRIFPWVTKEMEILPGDTVLVYTSLQGILYNSNLLAKDRAPKTYEDLVDPKLSRSWEGKMAIPPYSSWLVELSLIWGERKVVEYVRKLLPLSAMPFIARETSDPSVACCQMSSYGALVVQPTGIEGPLSPVGPTIRNTCPPL